MDIADRNGLKLVFRAALIAAVAGAVGLGGWFWWSSRSPDLPAGFARANGRIEATRIDVSLKYGGRIAEVLVAQGGLVGAGDVVARIEATELEAQLRAADAALLQRHQERVQADALIAQREGELSLARSKFQRAEALFERGVATAETLDVLRSQATSAVAALTTAKAQRASAEAAIAAADSNVAALAARLADHVLTAPRAGRVQYRLAEPGEILPVGGKVVSLLDLTDVYMDIYLPTDAAGQIRIGGDARLILDAAPQYVVPASVTFVASEAQFTPKYVETESERAKLMFRVRLKIPAEILIRYAEIVKAGLPGHAVVKVKYDAAWPPELAVKLP